MNSNSILPYIDYEAFKRNPKIIIGYSDVTAILLAIYAQTGITTYYGPALVASFGELLPFVDYTYKYFKEVTMDNTKIPYVFEKPEYWTDEYINIFFLLFQSYLNTPIHYPVPKVFSLAG
jgi:muramoyltetrapeptide carboxypeptidase